MTPEQVERVYRDIDAKRRAAEYVHAAPLLAGGSMTYTVCETDSAEDRRVPVWISGGETCPGTSPARYAWLYEAGPASALLLHSGNDQVVGSTGLMRRNLCVFGEMLPAGQAIDLNVDHDHRTIGPALELQRAVIDAVSDGELGLVYGFPNRRSEAVLRRVGYQVLGEVDRWLKPLSCRAAIRRFCPRLLSQAVAPLVDPLLRLGSRETFCRRPPGVRVEQLDDFDPRFDRLWEKATGLFPILGEAQQPVSPLAIFAISRSPVRYSGARRFGSRTARIRGLPAAPRVDFRGRFPLCQHRLPRTAAGRILTSGAPPACRRGRDCLPGQRLGAQNIAALRFLATPLPLESDGLRPAAAWRRPRGAAIGGRPLVPYPRRY